MAYNQNSEKQNKRRRTPRDIESQAHDEIAYQKGYARRRADAMDADAEPGDRASRAARSRRRSSYARVLADKNVPPKTKPSGGADDEGRLTGFLEGLGLLRKFAREKKKGYDELTSLDGQPRRGTR